MDKLEINETVLIYNGSELSIRIMKPSKELFEKYLYTPPEPMTGSLPVFDDPYPNETIFKITQMIFNSNPYRTELPFPYPDSEYEVLFIDVEND
jgi:hypothetical protein